MGRWKASPIIWALCLFLWEHPPLASELSPQPGGSQTSTPLYLLILMDTSGSMQETDPQGFRKLAAQAIVTLLSPEDRVAIVEFDADGRVRLDWHPASDREVLWRSIQEVGQAGAFTDFRAGLEKSWDLMKGTPPSARRVILLLTDGKLEPNPWDNRYAPYNSEYLRATVGKTRAERMKIYQEQFRDRLSPVARRILETEILPALKGEGIEVYAVGFGPTVDKSFLETLTQTTTQTPQERRTFYVQEAIDWVPAFLQLLAYWDNRMLFRVEEGEVQGGGSLSLFVDEFMRDVFLIVVTQEEATLWVRDPQGQEVGPVAGTHPNLKIVPLTATPPARWTYGFTGGRGRYRLMVTGRSFLSLEVRGLQDRYLYGQEILGRVRVRLGPQDARPLLDPSSRVKAEVWTPQGQYAQQMLNVEGEDFVFRYRPTELGTLHVKFILFAWDRQGREMLPRPTREYRVEVIPHFFVEPAQLDFGRLKPGQEVGQDVRVHSGLPARTPVRVKGRVVAASRCGDRPERVPYVREDTFWVALGEVIRRPVRVGVPRKGCWGDFEGEITFQSEAGPRPIVKFRVHVPSIWEYATWGVIIIVFVVVGSLIFLGFLYIRSTGRPRGVLQPVQVPPPEVILPIHLARIRPRGWWRRYIQRNTIRVGTLKPDVLLSNLSDGVCVSFVFHRGMQPLLRNDSHNPDVPVEVRRGGLSHPVPVGRYYSLQDGDRIQIGPNYIFEYRLHL